MNEELAKIAQNYGTPSFIFDISLLKKRMEAIKNLCGNKIHLCYSIKANPFLIPAMLSLEGVEKLEVCSPGELDICKHYKVPADKIIYSGVNKTQQNIHDAVAYNAGIYTAESLLQVEELEKEAEISKKSLPVLLRLTAGSQFGMSKEVLYSIIENKNQYPHLEIKGIHYFAGTQRKRSSDQEKDLQLLKNVMTELKENFNFTVEKLEYGPGLPFPYFEGDDFSDTLSPIKSIIPDLQSLAESVELTIEMGRFFVSECGNYLTTVMDTKNNFDTNYVILDGGINHLSYLGQLMGMKVPLIEIISKKSNLKSQETEQATELSADENIDQTLCGSLCTTADVLVRKVTMPPLQNGDILAFKNCGAYTITEGMYLFLSRTMPKVILLDEDSKGTKTITLAREFIESSSLNRM